ncbi:MAG: glutamine synthetase family protein [Alphaproteobacteria bacterium]
MSDLIEWITRHRATEVECLVPDISGIARGKILPASKFKDSLTDRGLRLPEAIFVQTVTGEFADSAATSDTNSDVYLVPDASTIRPVPWYEEPTAQVICDAFYADGSVVDLAPRYVLQRVLALYAERGWRPVVAPEIEFFLVKVNADPDYPLEPPIGRSGRMETGRQAYGIEAANEFDPIVEDLYDYCEAQGLEVDTINHEAGAAQMEINFQHGDALDLADQVFVFKRTLRQAANKHKVYATFMAKPMQDEPGSAMHIHQSVVDADSGRNLFATATGLDSALFRSHIAGLQKFIPTVMPVFAPNPNSYRRLRRHSDAPINTHWGQDNRTCGLRVPISAGESRRVENRVAGADVNPYLAIAASLACGYLGMTGKMKPKPAVTGSAYRLAYNLPQHLPDALSKMSASRPMRELLGDRFVDALIDVKREEWSAYQAVISPWEREHLLLNV